MPKPRGSRSAAWSRGHRSIEFSSLPTDELWLRVTARGDGSNVPGSVEGGQPQVGQRVVVDQGAAAADEEVGVLGHVEVEDRLHAARSRPTRPAPRPSSVRSGSPAFRSRAITQPLPAFQNRWNGLLTIVSPPSAIRNVLLGGLWWTTRTGW